MSKPSLALTQQYLDKWVPRFGFGHYHYKLRLIDTKAKLEFWARSWYSHEEEFFELEIVPDGVLPPRQHEGLVLHELTHGFLSFAETGPVQQETACNRLPRLLLGSNLKLANEYTVHNMERLPDGDSQEWMAKTAALDPVLRKEILRGLVDALPGDERQVIEGIYFERVGMETLARRMGVDKWKVRRLRNKAHKRLGERLQGLEDGLAG